MSHDTKEQQLLSAYLDGELSAVERAVMEKKIAERSELQQRLADWENQRSALKSLPNKTLEKDLSETILKAIENSDNPRSYEFHLTLKDPNESLIKTFSETNKISGCYPSSATDSLSLSKLKKNTKIARGRYWMAAATATSLLLMILILNFPAVNQRLGLANKANKTELTEYIQSVASSESIQAEINIGSAIPDQELVPFHSNAITLQEDQQLKMLRLQSSKNKRSRIPETRIGEETAESNFAASDQSVASGQYSEFVTSNEILFIDLSNQSDGIKLVSDILKTNQIQIASNKLDDSEQPLFGSSRFNEQQPSEDNILAGQSGKTDLSETDRQAIANIQQAFSPGIEAILVVAKQSQLDQIIEQLNQQTKIVSFKYPEAGPFILFNEMQMANLERELNHMAGQNSLKIQSGETTIENNRELAKSTDGRYRYDREGLNNNVDMESVSDIESGRGLTNDKSRRKDFRNAEEQGKDEKSNGDQTLSEGFAQQLPKKVQIKKDLAILSPNSISPNSIILRQSQLTETERATNRWIQILLLIKVDSGSEQ